MIIKVEYGDSQLPHNYLDVCNAFFVHSFVASHKPGDGKRFIRSLGKVIFCAKLVGSFFGNFQ